jgi:cell wall assembly regulator SMI1
MQKFTRALTREIEVGGERLAVTLSEEGLTVRPVGARRPPHTLSWAACVSAAVGHPVTGAAPTESDLAEVVKKLKAGAEKPGKSSEQAATSEKSVEAAPAPTETPHKAHANADALPALLARLDHWLAQHRRRFHKALLPGATPEQLAALKAHISCPLPDELRTVLEWHNGQDPEVVGGLEGDFALLSTEEIVQAKKELDAEGHEGWNTNWLPFLEDSAGNCLVVDAQRPGAPVLDCWQGRAKHDELAPSLTAWVRDFVGAVERGDYAEDPERGGFHRKKG